MAAHVSIVAIAASAFMAFTAMALITKMVLKNHFRYPYFEYDFDVSRKRNVEIEDYIDKFLCNAENRSRLRHHEASVQVWKAQQEANIEKSPLKKLRRKQYASIIDDDHAYRFQTTRDQTRYKQRNYAKKSYVVTVPDECLAVDWTWLVERSRALQAIDYEATLKEYHAKNQRRLMTPKLRQKIKERDNYTCQICGKYMPDEVGLHIDHMVPVAKGGKTVPSNLQVLCSKCNSSKGAKLVDED